MKNLNRIFVLLLIVSVALLFASCGGDQQEGEDQHDADAHEQHEGASQEGKKKPLSPRTDAMANIGETHVHINYSSPGVRGRTIWGGLVQYGEVWVTGAHSATSIEFYGDVKIDGKVINKGKYALFTIPGEKEWTIIINENYDMHLADDYDSKLDVVRISATPEALNEVQESLTFAVESTTGNDGKIAIMWDKVRVSFDVEAL